MAAPTTHKRKKNTKDEGRLSKKPKGSAPSNKNFVKQERQSQRKHADIVNEAKRIWNQLRMKTNTPEQNRKFMDELMPLIDGKSNEIALQHDASRVVQAAIQFGNEQERRKILSELTSSTANFAELCKSQYAHFTVLKALKYCHSDEKCLRMMVKAFKGHVPKLAVHAVASRVVETVFQTFPKHEIAVLKQELYGPHFALFTSDVVAEGKVTMPTLQSNLTAAPEKKEVTLNFVRNLVNKMMEKSLYGFSYFQELFAEFLAEAPASEIRVLASTGADNVIHLLSTKAGTRAAAHLISYGTAKDRKRIMKSLKGYSRSGLLHSDAYLAIIRLIELTDDTVSIQKNVLAELTSVPSEQENSDVSPLLEIALSDTGSKLFLMLLISDDDARSKCFDPYEHSVLFPNPTITENGEEVPTSKKGPEVRRNELLKYLRDPLVEMCKNHTEELLRSLAGSSVLRRVYSAFHPQEVVDAVIKVCQGSLVEQGDGDQLPLFEDGVGHMSVKHLFVDDEASKESLFSAAFVKTFAGHLMEVAESNRGAFVIASLCKVESVRQAVVEECRKSEKKLRKLAKGKGATAGFDALLKEVKR